MNVELARHQWAEGRRALDRARSDPAEYDRLAVWVRVLGSELSRRVGQIFTLEELVDEYEGADRWALEAVHEAFPDDALLYVSTAADVAFDLYSRRASDYAP